MLVTVHGQFLARMWGRTGNSWLEKPTLEKYFGVAENLDDMVWQSQTLQAIGYKVIWRGLDSKKAIVIKKI